MSEEITIRPMTIMDIPRCVEIGTSTFMEMTRRPSLGVIMAEHLEKKRFDFTYVAELDGKAVGYLLVEYFPEENRFGGQFGIDPAHTKHGIGSRIFKDFEVDVKGMGVDTFLLGTSYAEGFYEKLGYETEWTTFNLTLEMVANPLPEEPPLKISVISRDDVVRIIGTVPEPEALKLLQVLYEVLEKHSDKCLIGCSDGEIKGVVVGQENKNDGDLAVVKHVWGDDLNSKLLTLDALARRVSWQGKRFLGVEVTSKEPEFLRALKGRGYKDIHLPDWYTVYWMRKVVE